MVTVLSRAELIAEEEARIRLQQCGAIRCRPAAAPISKALGRVLGAVQPESLPPLELVRQRWTEIVGAKLGAISEPLVLERGRQGAQLTVRAPSAAAPIIQHAMDHILERLSLAAGVRISTLRIRQTGAAPRAREKARLAARASPETIAALAAQLQSVRTPAVRNALQELGEAVLASRG
jgi:hypothetical protein